MFKDVLELSGYVTQTVPFYREFRGEAFEKLPVVGKKQIRSNFRNFASRECPNSILEDCERLAKVGCTSSELRRGDWYLERSSGTTGPAVWYPRRKTERIEAAIHHYRIRQRVFPTFNPSLMEDMNELYSTRGAIAGYGLHPKKVYAELRARGVRHLYGQLHLLATHAKNLMLEGRSFGFESAEVGGGYPEDEIRKVIRTAFGAKVICQYGCREVLAIGAKLEQIGRGDRRLVTAISLEERLGGRLEECGRKGGQVGARADSPESEAAQRGRVCPRETGPNRTVTDTREPLDGGSA